MMSLGVEHVECRPTLVADKVFCIIAGPVVMRGAIKAWQVLQHLSVNVAAWFARKEWQRADLEKVPGRKRSASEAFAEKPRNGKDTRSASPTQTVAAVFWSYWDGMTRFDTFTDGWKDRRMDRWIDRWMDRQIAK